MQSLVNLPLAEYQFIFRAIEPIELPKYSGSMWRGAFGHALREIACCGEEKHKPDCIYSFLFEQEKDHFSQVLPYDQSPPVPYVFKTPYRSPTTIKAKQYGSINILLVGAANNHIYTVIEAMKLAMQRGIGKGRKQLELDEVIQINQCQQRHLIYGNDVILKAAPPQKIIPPTCTHYAKIKITTPLNLNDREVFDATHFLMSSVRCASLLQRCYGEYHDDYNFEHLKQKASQVRAKTKLYRTRHKRYSSRQQSFQPVNGWMGEILLHGSALSAFLPFLHIGQWLHLGKMRGMGMGRYELQCIEWL